VVIIKDLPPGGRHSRRTLGIGPDKLLYISIGSSCNACIEKDSNYATIETASLDGTNRRIFARGLRNTLGFDWDPQTGQLWGMDQGSDERGDTIPPEELNLLIDGKNYGWPFVYGKRCPDPIIKLPPQKKQQFILSTEPAVLTYTAHSSPIGFVFYKGTGFPQYYLNGAFVTFRGSWNRTPPSGYKVAFVKYENGRPLKFEDFITGFLSVDSTSQFARVTGITVANDGSILFCDDENGMVYRVDYKK
jgi:glucose/arabinose dehydrogenase